MKTLLFILLTCFALIAHACIAMLVDEYPGSGYTEKVCVYNHQGDTVTTVVSSGSICASYINVEH
ncbi:unnamed protein product [marine sediment metagenome]|uniref:Uncharacterized protein n=1 Tax=marine sediment metagenome TaxID=412755 RepID=X0WER4_9ZZZZ